VTPQRIQRKRTKGWRMPVGAVYVGRPTKWGNPFAIGSPSGLVRIPTVTYPDKPWEYKGRISAAGALHPYYHPDGRIIPCHVYAMTPEQSVLCFEAYVRGGGWPLDWKTRFDVDATREELCGKDLVCWCSPNQPCHADVLLRIANEAAS